MALHLVKLCVGAESVEDLATWQASAACPTWEVDGSACPVHVTRMHPKQADALLEGGSLYWVIKGQIRCRQRLVGVEAVKDGEGTSRCALILHPAIVLTRGQPKRPFQGWRYLKPEAAPEDAPDGDDLADMPAEMRAELEELGLL